MSGNFSSRPLKLSPTERERLLHWYKVERTPAYMASQLGISVRTLYRYVMQVQKPRREKPDIDKLAAELMAVSADVPHETLRSEIEERA